MSPEARLAVANTGSSHRGGEGDHLRENSKYTRLNAKRPRVLISTVHKSQCTERTHHPLALSRSTPFSIYVYMDETQDPIWSRALTAAGDIATRRASCHMYAGTRSAACAARVREYAPMHVLRLALSGPRPWPKMGRGARCSSSVSVSRAARAGVTRPAGGG